MKTLFKSIANCCFYIFTAFITLCPTIAAAYELPDLGSPAATILSPKEEKQLTKEFMRQVRLSVSIQYDSIVTDYIQTLGNRLVAKTDAPKRKLHFFVVQDAAINAFSGPGGYVGVNSGLILTTQSESELAAVIAHEITHVTQHHIERSLQQAKRLNIPMTAAILAAIVLGASSGNAATASAASGAAMSTMAGGTQHMLNFTRENESEADHIGMKIMYNAGFNPDAVPAFFGRMQKLSMEYGEQPPQYLLTHPLTNERMADAENRATQYAAQNPGSSKAYYLTKARLKLLAATSAETAANYFRTQMGKNSDANSKEAAQYGYALALLAQDKTQAATQAIVQLRQTHPDDAIYAIAAADINVKNHQKDAAIKILRDAITTHPNYFPLNIEYAAVLLDAGDFATAKIILEKLVQKYPDNAVLYYNLADAQAKSGQIPYAYYSRAKAFELKGNYKEATILLQKALELPNLSEDARALLQTELAKVHAMKINNAG